MTIVINNNKICFAPLGRNFTGTKTSQHQLWYLSYSTHTPSQFFLPWIQCMGPVCALQPVQCFVTPATAVCPSGIWTFRCHSWIITDVTGVVRPVNENWTVTDNYVELANEISVVVITYAVSMSASQTAIRLVSQSSSHTNPNARSRAKFEVQVLLNKWKYSHK